jgi:hypothetical protein
MPRSGVVEIFMLWICGDDGQAPDKVSHIIAGFGNSGYLQCHRLVSSPKVVPRLGWNDAEPTLSVGSGILSALRS